jgi:hypothetical protein
MTIDQFLIFALATVLLSGAVWTVQYLVGTIVKADTGGFVPVMVSTAALTVFYAWLV